jgi:hypothetical protein
MIALIKVAYPMNVFKQVVQAFTSPDIPKRPESVKEISAMGYFDGGSGCAVFMFDVPDAEAGEFLLAQAKRTAFMGARVPGFQSNVHMGQSVGEAIPTMMAMYP